MLTRRIFLVSSLNISTTTFFSKWLNARENSDYKITPMPSKVSLLENKETKTPVWAYDGLVPGPVIKAKKGEEISIEVFNQLGQPTTIHWHGIRIDNAMDGVAGLTQAPIQPGESFVYRFTPPDAGTYWYHPHNRTWEQLARGLYGALIVEGDATDNDFDKDYSILVDDWRLEDTGLIHEPSFKSMHDWSHQGRLGNILTLNGKHLEKLDVVVGERVRLRFINTSNARIMKFALENLEPYLIALDGQAVSPVPLNKDGITLAPAQRADLMVDIKGKTGDEIAIIENSGRENLVAGYLVCQEGSTKQISEQPAVRLNSNVIPGPDLSAARDLELIMTGGAMRFLESAVYKEQKLNGRELALKHQQVWAFNGVAGMAKKPFFRAKKGETIRLKLVNKTAWKHAIHLHGHHFLILTRNGINLDNHNHELDAYRDTVLLDRDETIEIALVTDNPGKWMMHCHMLEHQASGMGTWFEVI